MSKRRKYRERGKRIAGIVSRLVKAEGVIYQLREDAKRNDAYRDRITRADPKGLAAKEAVLAIAEEIGEKFGREAGRSIYSNKIARIRIVDAVAGRVSNHINASMSVRAIR